ncbi:MAG: hypothetical protein Q4G69_09060 [Planctomycetia bacterium]|nr:hypothetical protein [Planctomycetia bacterium]
MFRKILLLTGAVLLISSLGCRSCYSPYDYCQPTFIPERGDSCMNELYRSGSIFVDPQKSIDTGGGCKTCSGELPYSQDLAMKNRYISRTATEIPQMDQNAGEAVPGTAFSNDPALWSLVGNRSQDSAIVEQFDLNQESN